MTTTTTTTLRIVAQRLSLGSIGGISGYATYKAKYDPPHLVWDLDNTILCSVTPPPPTPPESSNYKKYDSFDQIDDDFPFEKDGQTTTPNTRTYWRPGARAALRICGMFAIQHVYTTAQGTYTANILNELDPNRTIFHTVIHRDIAPSSVEKGKDLTLIENEFVKKRRKRIETNNTNEVLSSSLLKRLVLFDDRVSNFKPQNGQNGIHVFPFRVIIVNNNNKNNNNDNDNEHGDANDNTNDAVVSPPATVVHIDAIQEIREIARLVGISVLCLLSSDVRSVVAYFQTAAHKKRFPATETTK